MFASFLGLIVRNSSIDVTGICSVGKIKEIKEIKGVTVSTSCADTIHYNSLTSEFSLSLSLLYTCWSLGKGLRLNSHQLFSLVQRLTLTVVHVTTITRCRLSTTGRRRHYFICVREKTRILIYIQLYSPRVIAKLSKNIKIIMMSLISKSCNDLTLRTKRIRWRMYCFLISVLPVTYKLVRRTGNNVSWL